MSDVISKTNGLLDFAEYSARASATAVYPGRGTLLGLIYVSLKGAGEAGEFSENVGKCLRDDDIVQDLDDSVAATTIVCFGSLNFDRRHKLIMELGDELWYLSQKAIELGTTLAEVASLNLDKLERRAAEGKIKGSGSDR